MNVKDTIKVFDNVIRPSILEGFTKYCQSKNFEEAKVVGNVEGDELQKIRKTQLFNFNGFQLNEDTMNDKIFTDIHWKNILTNIILMCNQRYLQDLKIPDKKISTIADISLLKYPEGGHYVLHSDYHTKHQREFSFILFVNDNFEGGDLTFADPDFKNETTIKVKKNRIVFFPSNFMFPHKVNPVKKGTRYSVVAWLK